MSPLLSVTDLTVTFPTDTERVAAVRGISYHVDPGEVVAMVGESGSGKSAAAMAVMGLLPEYAAVSGSVQLHGAELLGLGGDAASLLQTIPLRGSIPGGVPTDPTIYRFYEMLQVYGTTLKALIHEQFGDGIISAINFRLDVRKVPDPQGGQRAVITLDGKYLPAEPF
ncbi:Cyanate hydratase [Mycobacterium talmoniae]|uniref:Cyanate hydratase n=1 Tax=Mycobacterium talmoniae TaxID=1858794 RepID=A0A2S8BQS8_9MYCO|nr:Cyanate hydratase [Mycobacterium talmoniae]